MIVKRKNRWIVLGLLAGVVILFTLRPGLLAIVIGLWAVAMGSFYFLGSVLIVLSFVILFFWFLRRLITRKTTHGPNT